jgi:hypothetical protein
MQVNHQNIKFPPHKEHTAYPLQRPGVRKVATLYLEKYLYTIDWECAEIWMNVEYSETSIHRFHRRSEKETMDLGKQ